MTSNNLYIYVWEEYIYIFFMLAILCITVVGVGGVSFLSWILFQMFSSYQYRYTEPKSPCKPISVSWKNIYSQHNHIKSVVLKKVKEYSDSACCVCRFYLVLKQCKLNQHLRIPPQHAKKCGFPADLRIKKAMQRNKVSLFFGRLCAFVVFYIYFYDMIMLYLCGVISLVYVKTCSC